MLASNIPVKTPVPWANSAPGTLIRTVPIPSQIGIVNGAASWTDGYPLLTATQQSAGGYPPDIRDTNDVFNVISAWSRWHQAGGPKVFDGTFATAIGGYPNGAIIQSADYTGWWRSTSDNNSNNPDAGGANWVPHFFYGTTGIALSGANVTLTTPQAARPTILLTGTLTANVQIIFPSGLVGQWVVSNGTSGAFTVTAITSGGAGTLLGSGGNPIFSDGTNMYAENSGYLTTTQAAITYAPMASGTLVTFNNATAPTGWTKVNTYNDAVFRCVNGTPGSGGSQAFSTWNATTATGAHTLVTGEMPQHTHTVVDPGHAHTYTGGANNIQVPGGTTPAAQTGSHTTVTATTGIALDYTGGGGPHSHPLTQNILYVDLILASKN